MELLPGVCSGNAQPGDAQRWRVFVTSHFDADRQDVIPSSRPAISAESVSAASASLTVRKDLRPLFSPTSVAIIGCEPLHTQRVSSWPLHNLLLHRAPVDIYPVNPGYREIEGLVCYESIAILPAAGEASVKLPGPARGPWSIAS
jgi:hypothetical protein